MNVYDFGVRPRGYKPKNTAHAPRTRAGKTYPGGKHMRRALASLASRTAAYEAMKATDQASHTKPGSRKAY